MKKIDTFISRPYKYLRISKNKQKREDYVWELILEFLSLLKVVAFIDEPDESKLYNRSLIFFKEAKKRNLNVKAIKFFGVYVNDFKLIHNNKNYYYEGIPLTIFQNDYFDIDDKDLCKKILQENHVPVACGQLFTCADKAVKFGKSLGFPLVVKPDNGSLSHHVTCPIVSEEELLDAIKIAQQYTPAFIVEKYITGNLFRASVVGKSHVFVSQKDRAHVIGNGSATIMELINLKNAQKSRGDTSDMNTTLHKIPIDENLIVNLEDNNMNLETIISEGTKMYLQDKYVLSHGCDVINCSKIVHNKNMNLFIRIANILRSDLIGVDFICPDISKPYTEQETAVLEVNSLPYIDMHQYPSDGEPEPVVEVVWDIVLSKLDNKTEIVGFII